MNKFLFFMLFFWTTLAGQSQNIWVAHYFDTLPCFDCVHAYTWVDNATLRMRPGKDARPVGRLPIGSGCRILRESHDTLAINGIESVWYEVKTDSGQGWIWGGLMTRWCAGSQSDPEVKFFVGYEQYIPWSPVDTSIHEMTWMQIRAVRNHQEIAKYRFDVWEPVWNVTNAGNRGLTPFKDVIAVEESGESCGHFSGAVWLFWDGERFLDRLVIGGVADGDFSVWDSPIFPTDIRGQKDVIVLEGEDYSEYYEPNAEYPRSIMERIGNRKTLEWSQGKWVQNKAKNQSEILYYMVTESMEDTIYLPQSLPEEYRDWINSSKENQK
jgi:hypothetical protein